MSGRSHEDIEIQRSLELQALYNDIVTKCGQEGLMFKDLASPYYLGAASRNKGSWWKIKVRFGCIFPLNTAMLLHYPFVMVVVVVCVPSFLT